MKSEFYFILEEVKLVLGLKAANGPISTWIE